MADTRFPPFSSADTRFPPFSSADIPSTDVPIAWGHEWYASNETDLKNSINAGNDVVSDTTFAAVFNEAAAAWLRDWVAKAMRLNTIAKEFENGNKGIPSQESHRFLVSLTAKIIPGFEEAWGVPDGEPLAWFLRRYIHHLCTNASQTANGSPQPRTARQPTTGPQKQASTVTTSQGARPTTLFKIPGQAKDPEHPELDFSMLPKTQTVKSESANLMVLEVWRPTKVNPRRYRFNVQQFKRPDCRMIQTFASDIDWDKFRAKLVDQTRLSEAEELHYFLPDTVYHREAVPNSDALITALCWAHAQKANPAVFYIANRRSRKHRLPDGGEESEASSKRRRSTHHLDGTDAEASVGPHDPPAPGRTLPPGPRRRHSRQRAPSPPESASVTVPNTPTSGPLEPSSSKGNDNGDALADGVIMPDPGDISAEGLDDEAAEDLFEAEFHTVLKKKSKMLEHIGEAEIQWTCTFLCTTIGKLYDDGGYHHEYMQSDQKLLLQQVLALPTALRHASSHGCAFLADEQGYGKGAFIWLVILLLNLIRINHEEVEEAWKRKSDAHLPQDAIPGSTCPGRRPGRIQCRCEPGSVVRELDFLLQCEGFNLILVKPTLLQNHLQEFCTRFDVQRLQSSNILTVFVGTNPRSNPTYTCEVEIYRSKRTHKFQTLNHDLAHTHLQDYDTDSEGNTKYSPDKNAFRYCVLATTNPHTIDEYVIKRAAVTDNRGRILAPPRVRTLSVDEVHLFKDRQGALLTLLRDRLGLQDDSSFFFYSGTPWGHEMTHILCWLDLVHHFWSDAEPARYRVNHALGIRERHKVRVKSDLTGGGHPDEIDRLQQRITKLNSQRRTRDTQELRAQAERLSEKAIIALSKWIIRRTEDTLGPRGERLMTLPACNISTANVTYKCPSLQQQVEAYIQTRRQNGNLTAGGFRSIRTEAIPAVAFPTLVTLSKEGDFPADWTDRGIKARKLWADNGNVLQRNAAALYATSSKMGELTRLIDDAQRRDDRMLGNAGEPRRRAKVVITSYFPFSLVSTYWALQHHYGDQHHFAFITADVSHTNRQKTVDRFQERIPFDHEKEGMITILLGSLRIIAEGYTLTEATTIVFLEPQQLIPLFEQGRKRIHRYGQRFESRVIVLSQTDSKDERAIVDRKLEREMQQQYLTDREWIEDDGDEVLDDEVLDDEEVA